MSMWTDSDIANKTLMEDIGGKRCFVIQLPHRKLALPCGEQPNAKVLINWCEKVRAQVQSDEEEQRARDARDRAVSNGGPVVTETEVTTNETPPVSPRDFIKAGYHAAHKRLLLAQGELEVATGSYTEWKALMAALPEEE